MNVVALSTLLLFGLFAISAVAPVEIVGEAAALECDTYAVGDVYVNACDAVCAVGERVLRAPCVE